MEVGQRNQEVKILIQNWCGHARIEKAGGTGMIEAATGFPIGHHSMACDHAPAGGIATWYLEEAALAFYDRNCINCTVRQPLRFPNLVELVGRRDQQVAAMVAHQERQEKKLRDEFDFRQKVRAALQANAVVPVVSLIEDQRWPRSIGQFSEIFKWSVRGNHAADLIAGSVAKYASSGV
ncbi:hypothetical protein ACTXHA_27545 [Burkholderia cenocepacia]